MPNPEKDTDNKGKGLSRRSLFRLALGGGITLGFGTYLVANSLARAVESLFIPRSIEAADEVPIDFLKFTDSLIRSREWKTVNGTDPIAPNEPIRGHLPTIKDSINGAEPVLWQASRGIYLEKNLFSIASIGQRVDIAAGKFYMANQIKLGENLEVLYPRIEMGEINNPADYTTHRLLPTEGLPQGGIRSGTGGAYNLFKRDKDTISNYLDVGIKNSINPSEDGLYKMRFDKDGLPITIWVQISSGMSRRYFIPFINNQG